MRTSFLHYLRLPSSATWCFVICLITTLTHYSLTSFYDDYLDDSWRLAFMQGIFNQVPVDDWFVYHIFLSKMYVLMYSIFFEIPWFWLANYAVLSFVFFVSAVTIVGVILQRGITPAFAVIIGALIFVVLCIKFLFVYSLTRSATVGCGLSVLIIPILGSVWNGRMNALKWLLYPCIVFFILTRYETALFGTTLAAVFMLRPFKWPSASLQFAAVIFFSVILWVNFYPGVEETRFRSFENYAFSYHDSYIIKEKGEDWTLKEESMKQAFDAWFLADTALFNETFLSLLTDPNLRAYTVGGNKKMIDKIHQHKEMFFYTIFTESRPVITLLIGLWFIIVLLLLLDLRNRAYARWVAGLLLMNLCAVLVVMAITVVVKMENRLLSPGISVICFANLLLFFRQRSKSIGLPVIVLLLLFVPVLWMHVDYTKSFYVIKKQEYESAATARAEINMICRNEIVVMDLSAQTQMSLTRPFEKIQFDKSISFFPLDAPYPMHYTGIRQSLLLQSGTINISGLFDYLLSHKEKVIFICEQNRVDLYRSYMEAVYGKSYRFTEVNKNSWLSNHIMPNLGGRNYRYYRMY